MRFITWSSTGICPGSRPAPPGTALFCANYAFNASITRRRPAVQFAIHGQECAGIDLVVRRPFNRDSRFFELACRRGVVETEVGVVGVGAEEILQPARQRSRDVQASENWGIINRLAMLLKNPDNHMQMILPNESEQPGVKRPTPPPGVVR